MPCKTAFALFLTQVETVARRKFLATVPLEPHLAQQNKIRLTELMKEATDGELPGPSASNIHEREAQA